MWWHATQTPTLLVGRGVGVRAVSSGSGARIVPRPTGGGAILAGPGVVGLDIAMPADHGLLTGDIVRDYRWLGEVWADALLRLGLNATPVSIEECRDRNMADAPDHDLSLVCFGTVSPFEVVVDGRKVVGLSQVRRQGGVVFSSAVHIDVDPAEIAFELPLSNDRRASLARVLSNRAASVQMLAGRETTASEVIDAFRLALRSRLGVRLRRGAWGKREVCQLGAAQNLASTGLTRLLG